MDSKLVNLDNLLDDGRAYRQSKGGNVNFQFNNNNYGNVQLNNGTKNNLDYDLYNNRNKGNMKSTPFDL